MAKKQEQMVSVTIPRGRKQEENFVIVSVNGRSWKIMKGVQVQVPDYVAEVLENSRMMAETARRYVLCGGKRVKVKSNTASQLTLEEAITVADNAVIYPGEGGKDGLAVYGCLFVGKGAYGVVDLSEGTEVIVKPRGSSGTADPLDQRSSVGWKGIHAAAILYDEYIVRVECGSSYSAEDKSN